MSIERMHPADHAHAGSIRERSDRTEYPPTPSPAKGGPPSSRFPRRSLRKSTRAVGRKHFQEAIDHFFRFGMVVVVLAHLQLAAGREVEQTLHGFDFLNGEMIELAAQLPEQQRAGRAPGENQQPGQHRHVPQRQAHAQDASAAAGSRLFFSQNESDAAHSMQQFLLELAVDLAAQADHLRVDHVVERSLPRGFLPDFARQHLARHHAVPIGEQIVRANRIRAPSVPAIRRRGVTERCATSISRSASLQALNRVGLVPGAGARAFAPAARETRTASPDNRRRRYRARAHDLPGCRGK